MFDTGKIRYAMMCLLVLLSIPSNGWAQSCAGDPVAVQILGSSGPRTNPDRASASYLLWVGADAKMIVDMGGGAFFRFGQTEAKFRPPDLAQ